MKKAYLRAIFDQCSHFIPLMFSKRYKISKMARYRLIISLISARYRLIIFLISENNPQTHRDVFYKKGILRNFAKFTGKHLLSLWRRCFPVNFAKFLRAPFLTEHLWWLLLETNVFWYILWIMLTLVCRENCIVLRNSFS